MRNLIICSLWLSLIAWQTHKCVHYSPPAPAAKGKLVKLDWFASLCKMSLKILPASVWLYVCASLGLKCTCVYLNVHLIWLNVCLCVLLNEYVHLHPHALSILISLISHKHCTFAIVVVATSVGKVLLLLLLLKLYASCWCCCYFNCCCYISIKLFVSSVNSTFK